MSFFESRQYMEMLKTEREREMRNRQLERVAALAARCCDAARSGLFRAFGLRREPQAAQPSSCACQ